MRKLVYVRPRKTNLFWELYVEIIIGDLKKLGFFGVAGLGVVWFRHQQDKGRVLQHCIYVHAGLSAVQLFLCCGVD